MAHEVQGLPSVAAAAQVEEAQKEGCASRTGLPVSFLP